MEKIILWCCLLLIPVTNGFFINSKDLRKVLNFLPTSKDTNIPARIRRPNRYHHRHHHHPHHHIDDDHHYHHQHDTKPEPIKDDVYDDYDYYHHERNDDYSDNNSNIDDGNNSGSSRQKYGRFENKSDRHVHHANCKHYSHKGRQQIKRYRPKHTKPAKPVYQQKLPLEYEDDDGDYNEEYDTLENKRKLIKQHRIPYQSVDNRQPLKYKQDYVTGVLATIPKIKDTDLDSEYFEQIKFNNPFVGELNENYGDVETQTELITKPFSFLDDL